MLMRFYSVLIFLSFLVACKNDQSKKDSDLAGDLTTVQLPEGFLTFLDKFSEDSIYQIGHIIWPATVELAKEDKDEEPYIESLEAKDWILHKEFDDAGGTYVREFVVFNDIVTEVTQDVNGMFNMTRRFSKIDGEWMLIYYKEMGY
jgi:hypothetical protein